MTPKNTICLWFDKDAHDAARFYAATFPDSEAAGASPGRSPRARSPTRLRRAAARPSVPSTP